MAKCRSSDSYIPPTQPKRINYYYRVISSVDIKIRPTPLEPSRIFRYEPTY